MPKFARDPHSFSRPEEVCVKHVDLDLITVFDSQILNGTAVLKIDRAREFRSAPLVLDTRDLTIYLVEAEGREGEFNIVPFEMGATDEILGTPLTIKVPPDATRVRVSYSTSPSATALQWLEPEQTAGKKAPFLFTQSQEIHARSWIPLQDTPSLRLTYSARISTPHGLLAVMNGTGLTSRSEDGNYEFNMDLPIPPYLIALGVGDIAFAPTGSRTGVYAESPVLEQAIYEFGDAEKMLEAAEQLYGPYRWGRFDVLVLPPSFPFGGMENPGLAFVTPTLIAGDRSAVSVIAHELAHAWSGNLVTNATWSDFWLNEGFTTYTEHRIQEQLYGSSRAEMEAVLSEERLAEEMGRLEPRDQLLHPNLQGRDPDCVATRVPYVKGALFLKSLESIFGRDRFDAYLKSYFEHFAFQSVTTEQAVEYLKCNLLDENPDLAHQFPLEEWLYAPGLPITAPHTTSQALTEIRTLARSWSRDEISADDLPARNWTTQEKLHFLESLPPDLGLEKMRSLDKAFHITESANTEILFRWLLLGVKNQYERAYPRLEQFLTTVGRIIYVKPLYEQLVMTEDGKSLAYRIYHRARASYHPLTQATVDRIVVPSSPRTRIKKQKTISKYYLNPNAQSNGDHEVHVPSCSFFPKQGNRLFLGDFSNCIAAVNEAKKYYSHVNGCFYCCPDCHTT